MLRTGEVTGVRGNWLEVTFCRPTDCEHCQACAGSQKETRLTVQGQAAIGDLAVVEMPQAQVMKASAIAYAIPLAGLMLGLVAGLKLFPQAGEGGGAIGALVGLALAVAGVALTERIRRKNPAWQPQLREVIPQRSRRA